ncbi:MAG TPA: valine--tRNA ligase [Balneolales bacterium]|nr:valine--tRNA ligase [Balneolales bacterium]
MQEIPKKYDPKTIEKRWYSYWTNHNLFEAKPNPDKKPFTIMMPPPNVTGRLHMGHALQSSVQDALIRIKRMQGFEALWLPGTDHAGIATQNVVEKTLKKEEGKNRHDVGRQKFVEKVWEWKDEYGAIIIDQMKQLGTSCDWGRQRFTMDEGFSRAVQEVFVSLYDEGLIYRGNYLVNWCPVDMTALSDEEVDDAERNGHLWYVRYPIIDSDDEYIVIATTRPETMLGDSAIAVHPEDERYKHLIGKKVKLPLMDREIPIVADDYVKMEFGAGALKITPAHDKNDFEIGERHNLKVINIMNTDGTINENGGLYNGMDRFEARKKIVADLEDQGYMVKIEDYRHTVPISSRSKAVIEPLISRQWFVKMEPLAKPALEAARNKDIRFYPQRWENEYYRWLENIRDWTISRQLWWGHRIPVWYYTDEDGEIDESRDYIVSVDQPEPGMIQDEDVLDTWFSSWLWPFATLGWPGKTEALDYFYPTNVLVSGYDILFFWIARMIMAGLHFTDHVPYDDIFITGMVKDKQGRWMSKSLGNGIDPLDMIDQYGADAVRYCLIILCAQGQDIKLDPTKFEMGRNFANKIWNAFRFLSMHMDSGKKYEQNIDYDIPGLVDRWMITRVEQTIKAVEDDLSRYRLNEALLKIYALVWNDFCDWYLELIKPDEFDEKMSDETVGRAIFIFETLMKLLHPFMPFITEEIWQRLRERDVDDALIRAQWPVFENENIYKEEAELFGTIQSIISSIRNIRAEMNVQVNTEIDVLINAADDALVDKLSDNENIFRKLLKIDNFKISTHLSRPKASASAVVDGSEIFVPLAGVIDFDKERDRIEKEVDRLEKFLKSINGKLNNEKFLQNAPESVVQNERNKKSDTETNLSKLKKILADFQ